jgi:hypothetical protein
MPVKATEHITVDPVSSDNTPANTAVLIEARATNMIGLFSTLNTLDIMNTYIIHVTEHFRFYKQKLPEGVLVPAATAAKHAQ